MKAIIIVNTDQITKEIFLKALETRKDILLNEQCDVVICDVTVDGKNKKYINWLKKIKKKGNIEVVEVYDAADPYYLVVTIGDFEDLPKFTNYAMMVKYNNSLVRRKTKWN